MKVEFQVNGTPREYEGQPMRRLLDVLRVDLGLTGTKEGCGEGECGACSVIVNGTVVNSCLIPIGQMSKSSVTTVEGLSTDAQLSPLQKAFLECGGAQCGICTPGMLVAARALLDSNPRPSRPEIKEAIAGNLCRCTGYVKIIDAIEAAALSEERH